MTRDEALAVLDLFPRQRINKNTNIRNARLKSAWLRVRVDMLPQQFFNVLDRVMEKRIYKSDETVLFDPSGRLEFVQSIVCLRTMRFAIKNWSRANRLPRSKMPIIVVFRRRWIVWNGTHRTIAAMLLKRKLRVRLIRL